MQFSTIAIVFAATFAAANPTNMVAKRTCGTLTGTPLQLCQEACKATCTVATAGLAKTLCEKACDLGPLRVRDFSDDFTFDPFNLDDRSVESEADLVARKAAAEADPEAHIEELVSRITGKQVCDAAVS